MCFYLYIKMLMVVLAHGTMYFHVHVQCCCGVEAKICSGAMDLLMPFLKTFSPPLMVVVSFSL